MKFWIKYTNGVETEFEAADLKEASWYAHNEGDHVLEWGS